MAVTFSGAAIFITTTFGLAAVICFSQPSKVWKTVGAVLTLIAMLPIAAIIAFFWLMSRLG